MSKIKIRRALISVSDKSNLIDFVRLLEKYKVEIISTGGTLKAIQDAGVKALPIDDFTGFPEMLDGRVKTLHPKVHGGLLYRRDKKSHVQQASDHGIEPIDMVIVNLYPFEKVTQNPDVDLETAIENIGGPSMLRSAAKNADAVAVVCDPADYAALMEEMEKNKGAVSEETRVRLALKVFERTSSYDHAIAAFLNKKRPGKKTEKPEALPSSISSFYVKIQDLRYGENPHQRAALYKAGGTAMPKHFVQLHGKELSYNNILDIEATLHVIREFNKPAACVIKHTNPCGIAQGEDLAQAVSDAVDCDPLSAFGGILAVNRKCDLKTAKMVFAKLNFFEIIVAPSFDAKALEFLKERKNLRILENEGLAACAGLEYRFLKSGGLLVQDDDPVLIAAYESFKKELTFPTKKKLSGRELDDLAFAFQCVKVVKSNAIVLTQGQKTVGIGAGQMSRVDSVEIACRKAGTRTAGSILASDAFFPMPDSIELAHKHGITAIIQPGGSIKDDLVIEACDRFGIPMALTGKRHFKH